jgi:hypothetical protein
MPDGFRIHVSGFREAQRALNRVDKGTAKAIRDGFKRAAEPVAADARSRISRYQGASLGTIRPRVASSGVFIRQGRGKRTGKRPDFGALQMRDLLAAASAGAPKFRADVEHELDNLIDRERLQ